MKSRIAEALRLRNEPVALLVTDEFPEGAARFQPGKQSCVMFLFASAAEGKTGALSREAYGCVGGGVGMGFGDCYRAFPGGRDAFDRFLSTGNEGAPGADAIAAGMRAGGAPEPFVGHFLHGERYKRSPELVRGFVEALPMREVPGKYVVFKPLSAVDPEKETPVTVSFLVDPDRLTALVILSNYDRPDLENVAIPWVAACQTVGLLGFREAESENPRGLVGLVDISARKYLGARGRNTLSFTVPFRRFMQMEGFVEGSFLEGDTWKGLVG
jgi:uncharacterized protein (DUF169 family)